MATWGRGTVFAAAAAVLLAAVVAVCTDRFASPPSADVARGSEQAFFVSGLYDRELPPGGKPLRWTQSQAQASFRSLRASSGLLSVELQGHRSAVRVLAGGSVAGTLAPGVRAGTWPIKLRDHSLDVSIDVEPFRAGDGRLLGTQLRHVTFTPDRVAGAPRTSLLLLFSLPGIALALFARASGCGLVLGSCLTGAGLGLTGWLLAHCGAVHSAYAVHAAVVLTVCGALAATLARLVARRAVGSGPWAFAAALAAGYLHLVLATSPLMTVSDAVFQAHMLERVAQGDLFPTSVTQHAIPFRIPYGVSFFALLAPLQRLGLDPVSLVRWGAAVSGLAGALGLLVLLAPRSPRLAAATVLTLQVLPGTFLVHSQGNLPNVFGQALTTLFLAWWAGSATGGWVVGAALFALAGLGHLSAAIVLAAVAVWLAVVGRADAREAHWRRAAALVVGVGAVAAYYASFARLILGQLPRLFEGAEKDGSRSVVTALSLQLQGAAWEWLGIPALLLAVIGGWSLSDDRLARAVKAFVWAAAALMVTALVSPVEVRYLYALTTPIAILAAAGAAWLWTHGRAARALSALLCGLQVALTVGFVVDRLLFHYR